MGYLLKETFGTPRNNTDTVFNTANRKYMTTNFTVATSYLLSKLAYNWGKNLTPTNNATAYIYNDNGSQTAPGTIVLGTSNSVPCVTFAIDTYTAFIFPTPVLLIPGTMYWVVFMVDVVDGTNSCIMCIQNGNAGRKVSYSPDAVTWTQLDATTIGNFKTYATTAKGLTRRLLLLLARTQNILKRRYYP